MTTILNYLVPCGVSLLAGIGIGWFFRGLDDDLPNSPENDHE